MQEADWTDPEGRFLAYILAPVEDAPGPLLIVLNASEQDVEYAVPAWPELTGWQRVISTVEFAADAAPILHPGSSSVAAARSVTVFTSNQ